MQTLRPGSLLRRTYRIDGVLGHGGFGITYLATDLGLDRKVAIKEFFPKDYCDRDDTTSQVTLGTQNTVEFVKRLKEKFLKEARNIAKFDHPGIIRIHAAFEENNTAYYVMDFIEGESLSEKVKRDGPVPERRALRYIEKVGDALEYVHAKKINHLDVKPANIMVRRCDDTPILIDFGLSKQYDSEGNQTSTTPTGISHGYAPMEQYNDGGVKEFSPQTDLYSLAASLYYLLSGVTPPKAPQLIDEDLTFPAGIPLRLVDPIAKAMSPARRHRQPTVAQFMEDIRKARNKEESTEIKRPTPTPEPKPKSQPKPTPKPVPDNKKKNLKRIICASVTVIAGISLGVWNATVGDDKDKDKEVKEVVIPSKGMTVTDMAWTSPLGASLYTGEVKVDTLPSGEICTVPHGKGTAKINSGKFVGAEYDGNFVSGKMEGETTYTLKNGDIFIGKFRNNEYYNGKYIDKASGEYFEGEFRNGGAPFKGTWYSADGKKLEDLPAAPKRKEEERRIRRGSSKNDRIDQNELPHSLWL